MRMMRKMMSLFFGRSFFGIRMASCREVVSLLADYVDEELPPDEKRSIDLHLKTCSDCRNYMNTYRDTVRVLGKLPDEPMPREFEEYLETVLIKRLQG